MVEKGLVIALVALAIAGSCSFISSAFDRLAQKTECGFEMTETCIIIYKAQK